MRIARAQTNKELPWVHAQSHTHSFGHDCFFELNLIRLLDGPALISGFFPHDFLSGTCLCTKSNAIRTNHICAQRRAKSGTRIPVKDSDFF